MEKGMHLSFYDQITRNKRKSYFLMFVVFLVFIALGYVISQIYSEGSFFMIMSLATIMSLCYIVFSYYNSDKIALASVGAKLAPKELRQYYNSVEGLSLASGMPMPRLYVMQNDQINAFASGRDPQHAVICVTTGCLEKLNKQELEGVLAHELSHVANFDIRFMTLVVVMVGMISIVSQMFLRSLWFRSSNDDRRGNAGAILMLLGIVLAILAPITVQLVQLAISRKREFTADATAVKFTRYPPGLANALKKIKKDVPMKVSSAIAPLFMSDPSRKLSNLMSTHPDINERIKILESM